ncbi:hypothetical protein [Muriicola sp.]|uniref:hypothetical protein n=1 Tax=Muriicola sp. TaxID=2020856 RepID=UPI003C73169F
MKPFYIVFLVIFIVYGCSKEEVENITTLTGIALISSNREPVSGGNIIITGYEDTALFGNNDRQRFSSASTTNTDGSFKLQVTTPENVDYLIIQCKIPGFFTTTECNPISCSGLKPGGDYSDLILYVTSNID